MSCFHSHSIMGHYLWPGAWVGPPWGCNLWLALEVQGGSRSHPDGTSSRYLFPVFARLSLISSPLQHVYPFVSYAANVCMRFGSYIDPLRHNACNRTASLRATAPTARFLAFFPPRCINFSPKVRRSQSGPNGPDRKSTRLN